MRVQVRRLPRQLEVPVRLKIVLCMGNQLPWNLENDTPNEIITEAVNEFAQNICVVIVLKLPNFQTRNFRIRFFMFLLMDPII